jgi:hypothetical protein
MNLTLFEKELVIKQLRNQKLEHEVSLAYWQGRNKEIKAYWQKGDKQMELLIQERIDKIAELEVIIKKISETVDDNTKLGYVTIQENKPHIEKVSQVDKVTEVIEYLKGIAAGYVTILTYDGIIETKNLVMDAVEFIEHTLNNPTPKEKRLEEMRIKINSNIYSSDRGSKKYYELLKQLRILDYIELGRY